MKRILVIEDDRLVRAGLVMALRRHGYEVIEAEQGASGLELAFAQRPDLVLSDINLPGQNGYDVLRELRARVETAVIPVILMTGEPQKADARSSMNLGADDYLAKPFAMETMLAAVAARLQRQEGIQHAVTGQNREHISLAEQLRRDAGDQGLVDRMTARGFRHILQAAVLVFVFTLIQMFVLHQACNQGMSFAQSLEHQGLPNLNHLAELREEMILFRLSSFELMFAREAQKPALASAAKNAQKQIKADLLEIKKLLQDPKGQELTTALETEFDALAQEFERMQGLEEKDFAGAMSVLDHDIPPKIQRVDEAVDKLNNLGYQFSDAQANAAFESFGRIKSKTFFYGGANIVLAMGLVVFVLMAATRTRSQLVKALEQLRSQAQELRLQSSALEAAANGIVITDQGGKILWVNQAFTQLTGYSAEEAVGQNPRLLSSGRHPRAFFAEMWATIIAGKVWHGELINKRKDGRCYDDETTITPVRGENGEIHHFIAIKHDISERKKIEQMLADERDLLQVLMDNMPDHIYFKDLDSRFTRINLAQARHLGLTKPEDAVGKSDADFFPSGDARQKLTEERCLMATGNPMLDLVEKSNTATGTHWVASTKVPIYGVDGKIAGLVGISHDITKIKLAEDELRWKTAFLEAQVSSSIDGILVVDEQGVKLLQNQRMTDLFKIPQHLAADQAATTQRQWIADMTVDPEQFLKRVHYLYSRPNETSRNEIELKDGTILDMYSSAVIDPGGKYYGRIWTFRDITKRKRAEEELQRKSAFLEAQVHSSIDGILVVDEQGRRVLQNQRMMDLFAVPQSVVDDTNDVKLLNWVTQMTQRPDQFIEQVRYLYAHSDQVSQDEIELKNGTILDRYSAPMTGKGGEFYGRVWTFRDITKRKRTELERQMMEVQLRQSQKLESVGQLAAGIAHEINTPTQYVGDNTRFFKDSFAAVAKVLDSYEALLTAAKVGSVTPELVARSEQILVASDLDYLRVQIPQALNETLEGVERVSKIVRAMKEFSHPGGREKTPADLNKAVESTVTVARNEWKYVADLKMELDPSLPFVPCFLGEFNQAILNLIVNAAHAIGDVVKKNPGTKGLITLQTRRDGEYVEVRVTDTGTGIPPAARSKIFEPFFTTKEVGKGTGQGLAMIYGSIVNRHGGTVTFETEVDRGTTFIMRLPVKPKAKAEAATPKQANGTT